MYRLSHQTSLTRKTNHSWINEICQISAIDSLSLDNNRIRKYCQEERRIIQLQPGKVNNLIMIRINGIISDQTMRKIFVNLGHARINLIVRRDQNNLVLKITHRMYFSCRTTTNAISKRGRSQFTKQTIFSSSNRIIISRH